MFTFVSEDIAFTFVSIVKRNVREFNQSNGDLLTGPEWF